MRPSPILGSGAEGRDCKEGGLSATNEQENREAAVPQFHIAHLLLGKIPQEMFRNT